MTAPDNRGEPAKGDSGQSRASWHARNLLFLCFVFAVIWPIHAWQSNRHAEHEQRLARLRLIQEHSQEQDRERSEQRERLDAAFGQLDTVFLDYTTDLATAFQTGDSAESMQLRKIADERKAAQLREMSSRESLDGLAARVYLQLWNESATIRQDYYQRILDTERRDAVESILTPKSRDALERAIVTMNRLRESNLSLLEELRTYERELNAAFREQAQLQSHYPGMPDPFGIGDFIRRSTIFSTLEIELIMHEALVDIATLLRDHWGSWTLLQDGSIAFNSPLFESQFDQLLTDVRRARGVLAR